MPRRTDQPAKSAATSAKSDKRDKIVRAAAECFERYGVQRTRVEDVAQAAGLSGTNFYNYYPSRSALIDAVVLARVEAIVQDTVPVIERSKTLRDAVINGLVDTVDLCRSDALFMEFLSLTRQNRLVELGTAPAAFGFDMLERVWRPALQRARVRNELRAGLDDNETIAWLGRVSLMLLLLSGTTSMEKIRETVAVYVAPALVND